MDLLSRYRPTLLAQAILIGSGLNLCQPVLADQSSQRYDLPSAPLSEALNRFAEQTGISLPYDPHLVEGKYARSVKGLLPAEMVLFLLLEGTDLTAVQASDGNWSLQPVAADTGAALELGSTMIQGQGMGEATEHSGSYTTGLTSVGSKTPTSIRQTPQSVSVVTQQLIKDQQMNELGDAMKMAPGVTVQQSNYRLPVFYSRGYKIENIQIDGAAPMALGTTSGSFYSNKSYNLAEFDHVEVLRGSAGLFGGTGDPGGIINLVRKRPLDRFQLNVDAAAGSWDNYRTQVDLTGPMGFDGKLRGRLVTSYADRQYFIDNRSTERPLVYGILEADITPDTLLTLGGRYERIHENGTSTDLPRYLTGDDLKLKRRTGLATKWSYLDGRSQEIFAKIDHNLSEDWKVNLTYTQTKDTGLSKVSFVNGAVDPADFAGPQWGGTTSTYSSEQKLWDLNLSGNFDLFGQTHQLVIGADHQKIESRWQGSNMMPGSFSTPVNVFDPESTPWIEPPTDKQWVDDYNPNSQVQYGLYSTLRLKLGDPLHLIVGARAQRYKFDQTSQGRDLSTGIWDIQSQVSMRQATKLVPFGGVVYDLNEQWSTYASYSEVFRPQQNVKKGPKPGTTIEPMAGKTYETGLKGELFDGKVNTSFALYYSSRENQAIQDANYPLEFNRFGGSCCYLPQGEVVSKGFDVEVSGEVLPDWMLIASYNYNHNKDRTANASLSSITPKHTARFWSTYKLPGALSDLTLGAGVSIQSATYVSGNAGSIDTNGNVVVDSDGYAITHPFKYTQSGYSLWNAMARYQIDEHWSMTYNVNNLFDKVYYQTVGSSSGGNYYGDPRNHMLTLRGEFW
ncbi:MAG: TonB-dependent siderophore receptor [Pseudomonas sp.]